MIKRQDASWRWKEKDPDALASVYMHTVPNGRMYIGVTCRDPELRWQRNGSAYRDLPEFFADIQKYGWDNIKHEILFQTKNKEEAYAKEEEYIRLYKDKYGDLMYNVTFGRKHTDSYKALISDLNKGKVTSEETKKKISDSRTELYGVPVICWETGERFQSYKQAADAHGIKRYANIPTTCDCFPNRTLGGYHWYRASDDISQKEIPLIKASKLPVRCIETGEVFNSCNDASKALNYSHPLRIVQICDGMDARAARHTWEWAS